jgi:predicted RNase H-like nuclease
VLGIDGSRSGWVAIALEHGFVGADGDRSIAALVGRHPVAQVVAIDMPIGLPIDGTRECDALARQRVGKRRSSVFLAPPTRVLDAPSHAAATAAAVALTGVGVSQQAYALRARVADVAELAETDSRVIEVHPEVSSWAMAEHEIEFSKHTWNGHRQRLDLLSNEGIELPEGLLEGLAGLAGVDDVVDAVAAAWSAARYAAQAAKPLPEGAQPGDRLVIWY